MWVILLLCALSCYSSMSYQLVHLTLYHDMICTLQIAAINNCNELKKAFKCHKCSVR